MRVCIIAPGAAETELLGHTTDTGIKDGYGEWKNSMGGAMSADAVVQSMVFAYSMPQNVCIREVVLAAVKQSA